MEKFKIFHFVGGEWIKVEVMRSPFGLWEMKEEVSEIVAYSEFENTHVLLCRLLA